ncbi:MAG: penicillin-binding protein [Prolixibacteraceae bacterium]|nr:MAG: penicillin-binding protein [Prolixibacteraceae bacterium]
MDIYSKRKYLVITIFIVAGLVFILRLFSLQVLDSKYKVSATNNVLRENVQFPARGLIYDRNGTLMVFNKPAYDLLVTPREVEKFDTVAFCKLLEISKEDLIAGIQKAKDYSSFKPSILIKQIPPESFAYLQEQLYKFKGFHTQSRTLREYFHPSAAHVLGYVSEVNDADIERDIYYKSGDYIGASGIERTYEKQLRGIKGVKKQLVDVHNRIKGSYLDGTEDIPAEIGNNIITTLDADLQRYAEELFVNKKGAMVAIEPETGEVLAMVSAPTYDPGLLVGRIRGANYNILSEDPLKPLFNRAIQAKYPPGSTFKIINTLIGLETGSINTNTRFACNGKASTPIRCTHSHVSPGNVVDAIRESCNPFLWNTFRSIIYKFKSVAEGFNMWRSYVESFGIGRILSTDFPNALAGDLPTEEMYSKLYGKGRWNPLTIRSLAIGQGELGATPLQMANVAAVVANRGYYYPPHLVREIRNDTVPADFRKKVYTKISPENFEPIITGMEQLLKGTLSYTSAVPGVVMCGKTGTVQNNQGSDHSVFTAFAPKDNPKIAIFVYVENGVWGSRYAAPMAGLMVEKYLNDTISAQKKAIEQRMIEANLLNPNQPD